MMNSVPAGVAGTVVEVCAGERASWSSTAQPLFRVSGGRDDHAGVHPQPRRDRGADRARLPRARARERGRHLRGRPRRAGGARSADRAVLPRARGRRRRATCATTSSCRRRSAPAATRSTPATAFCPRARAWPARAREHGLVFVGPPPEVDRAGRRQAAGPGGGRARRAAGAPGRARCEPPRRPRAGAADRLSRCWSRRPVAAAGAGSSWSRDAGELDGAAGAGAQRGRRGLRRRARLPRALHRGGAPHRGADRRRRARGGRSISASATARCSAATRR